MEVQGSVIAWSEGRARVQIAGSACVGCQQACAGRSLTRPSIVVVESAQALQPGQTVRVELSIPSPGKAVALTFLFPLLGLFSGLFLGQHYYGGAPMPSLGLALAGAALAFFIVYMLERRRRSHLIGPCQRSSEGRWRL